MPTAMATTNPTLNLTISTNFGLNNYESCGRILFTLEYDGIIKGLLISVSNATDSIVGGFEERELFNSIFDESTMGSCITHASSIAKSGPLTFYWIAPDTDDDLTITVFAVKSRDGEPSTTIWGETFLNITYFKSNCSIEDTNTTIEETTDTTEVDSTTEVEVTTEDGSTTEIVDTTDTTEVESTTEVEYNTEVDSTTEIVDTTDTTEVESTTDVEFTIEVKSFVDMPESFGDNTGVNNEASVNIEVTSKDNYPLTSQESTKSISSNNPPSSYHSKSSVSETPATSTFQESTSNTEQTIFGFGLFLFSLIF